MRLTGHQPQYLGGYAGYISKVAQADKYVYMDDVDYSKNDFINRNQIRTKVGTQMLTVPVLHKGHSHDKIKDIRIDNTKNWRSKHLKAIEQNYSKAPYFDYYHEWLKALYSVEWETLSDLNWHILKAVLYELEIETEVVKMSAYDFRGEKSELILDFCLQLKADKFLFGINGKEYVKPKLFYDAGVDIEFQDYKHPQYRQAYMGFEPYCCILDVLMNHGENSLDIIRGKS
jgi:hypothetical protein